MEKNYKYLGYVFLLVIPLTLAGFYKTYIVQYPHFEAKINIFTHLHAFIASIWILILIAQPFLIVNKHYDIHRTLGKLTYGVFPLLILSFIPQIIRIGHSEDPRYLFFPLADGMLLILFYSLAVYHRKARALHMRYMIATALVFLGPTLGRIGPILLEWSELMTQYTMYGIIFSVLISLVWKDMKAGARFYPYLVAATAFMLHQSAYYFVFVQ